MHYILVDDKRRQNCIDYLRGLDLTKPLLVDIKPYRKNRSNSQNSLYWMWLPYLCEHFGYSEEEMHEQLKVSFLGVEEKTVMGELLRQPKSTAKLKVQEFSDFLRKIEVLAAQNGISLPRPDDYKLCFGGKQ